MQEKFSEEEVTLLKKVAEDKRKSEVWERREKLFEDGLELIFKSGVLLDGIIVGARSKEVLVNFKGSMLDEGNKWKYFSPMTTSFYILREEDINK